MPISLFRFAEKSRWRSFHAWTGTVLSLLAFIGWKLYGEPMTGARLLSFGVIWLAVGIYAADARSEK